MTAPDAAAVLAMMHRLDARLARIEAALAGGEVIPLLGRPGRWAVERR